MQASAVEGSEAMQCNVPTTAAAHVAMHCSSPHSSRKPSACDTPAGFSRPVHAAAAHTMRGAAACAIMADTAGERAPCEYPEHETMRFLSAGTLGLDEGVR
jgi:hypothetical protein